MSLVWCQRSSCHVFGVTCLVLATLIYVTGHVAPFWVRQDPGGASVPGLDVGVWFVCPDTGPCLRYDYAGDEGFLKATRILQLVGLFGLAVSVAAAFVINCRRQRQHPGTSYFLPGCACFSALVGLSGSMVYLGNTVHDVNADPSRRYSWAFALNVAGSALALWAALFLLMDCLCSCQDSEDEMAAKSRPFKRWSKDALDYDLHRGFNLDPNVDSRMLVNDRVQGGHPRLSFVDERGKSSPGELYDPRDGYAHRLYSGAGYPALDNVSPNSRPGPNHAPSGRINQWQRVRSWQDGLEVVPMSGPMERHQHGARNLYDKHTSRLYAVPAPYMQFTPFVLPRVVLRGYPDSAYGSQQYVML